MRLDGALVPLFVLVFAAGCGGNVKPDPPNGASSSIAVGAVNARGPLVGALTSTLPPPPVPGRPIPNGDAFDLPDPDGPPPVATPPAVTVAPTASSPAPTTKPTHKPVPPDDALNSRN